MSTNNNWINNLCGRQADLVMSMMTAQVLWAESKGIPYHVTESKWTFSLPAETKPAQLKLVWKVVHPEIGPTAAVSGIAGAWPGDVPPELLQNVEIVL